MTKEGELRYKIVYPKFKKGGHTVRKIPVKSTYEYVDVLKESVFEIAELGRLNESGVQMLINKPPPLCEDYERPDKMEAVSAIQSRFNC